MPYDERLAQRVRDALARRRRVTEKKMFGGLSFLINGNMACGIVGGELMVRVGPTRYEEALSKRHAREMDFTGRPLNGYVYVARAGLRTADSLGAWVGQGVTFARTLPPK